MSVFDGHILFDGGKAPNPRRVSIFLAEKGIDIPRQPVDMNNMGHRAPEVTERNPLQRLPILQLPDGTILTESIAICRYVEGMVPEPNLFGASVVESALIEMWQRRMEFNFLLAVGNAFRHIHPAMKDWEVPQIAEWGEANKPKVLDFVALMDRELADREFIAGDRFTVADITGGIAIGFCKPARIELPQELTNFQRWSAAVRARPSFAQ